MAVFRWPTLVSAKLVVNSLHKLSLGLRRLSVATPNFSPYPPQFQRRHFLWRNLPRVCEGIPPTFGICTSPTNPKASLSPLPLLLHVETHPMRLGDGSWHLQTCRTLQGNDRSTRRSWAPILSAVPDAEFVQYSVQRHDGVDGHSPRPLFLLRLVVLGHHLLD